MKNLLVLLAMSLLVSQSAYSQEVYSEMPITAEGGILKCKRVVIAFNRNVIPTTAGVRIVDTARFPIQDVGVKTLLRQLSARYGVPTLRKTIPRLVWGDTLVAHRRTGRVSRVADMSQNFAVDFPVPVPLDSVLSLFRALPCVRYADQPISIHALMTPNDSLFGSQWYLETIMARQAWDITTGSAFVKIAIIDINGNGIVQNHPDFQLGGGGNKFVGGDGSLGGTHPYGVAGVAGAATNNETGIASLGWNVSLLGYSFKDLDNDSTQYRLPDLIDLATADGANVINCSFGTLKKECNPSKYCPNDYQEVRDAIARAIGTGVVVVAAAGNDNIDGCQNCNGFVPYLEYPGVYSGVLAVSGTTAQDQFVQGYNYGDSVDVAAPAENMWTLDPSGYGVHDGTSLSSPLVSALSALIISYNQNYTRDDVERFIAQTADKVGQYSYNLQGPYGTRNIYMGYGRINAYRALSMANLAPAAPQNLQVSAVLIGTNPKRYSPKLTWTANSEVDLASYTIYRRLSSDQGGFAVIGTVLRPTTSYIDYSVQTGNLDFAYYKITAVDAAPLESGFSNVVSIQVNATTKPSVEFWQELVQLPGHNVSALISDSSGYIFAGTDPARVYVSGDNGMTWNLRNNGLAGSPVFAFALGGSNHVYVTTSFGLYRTTNQGTSWTYMGYPFYHAYSVVVNSGGYIFVGAEQDFTIGRLYRSTDKGNTWTEFDFPRKPAIYTLVVSASDHVFAGTAKGIFRTTNDGATWDSVSVGLTTRVVWDLEIDNNGILYAGTYLGGVFRSTNNGDTWSFAGLPGEDVLALAINSRGHVFAGTTSHGVFMSLDNGASWSVQNSGLTDTVVSALALNRSGYAFAGCYPARVYRSVQSTTSVAPADNPMPLALHLEQNYPNPFNPTTVIRYSLPIDGTASLKVFDVLGREVATLIPGFKAAETYESVFDASKLASGIYVYRLQAGNTTLSRKMLVIK